MAEIPSEIFEPPEEKEWMIEEYEDKRDSLIEFYKQLVVMGEGEIPEIAPEAGRSKPLQTTEDLMTSKLGLLREGALGTIDETAAMVPKLCLAYFLIERCKELEEITIGSANASLYGLYLSLEQRVCEMLSERYYDLTFMEMMDEYLDTEPILTACSELCGLPVPSVEEILEESESGWLRQELS